MGYQELIEKLEALPEEKRTEVFDFVDFLSAKFAEAGDWTTKDFRDFSLAQALAGLEDDPVTYDEKDLRERWK